MAKARLDQLLVSRGLAESRTQAQALIMAGLVEVDGVRRDKSGALVSPEAALAVRGREHPWVSRGGMKLAHALQHFSQSVAGVVALDIGASHGGFTDVLLQHGARKVYAVDVGHGQLDQKLRPDPRVVVMENTNARHLTAENITEPIDLIVCDASFISLKLVLPAALARARTPGRLIALIKPQFEAGKAIVSRGRGVVRDTQIHQQVCDEIAHWLTGLDWHVQGITQSPITGAKGNQEFLIYATRGV